MEHVEKSYSYTISTRLKFGYGYTTIFNRRQYYAWYGMPNGEETYYIKTLIGKDEFDSIEIEYPKRSVADSDKAKAFHKKYIYGHIIIDEGKHIIP